MILFILTISHALHGIADGFGRKKDDVGFKRAARPLARTRSDPKVGEMN
jgi:hypothetical protein